MIESFKRFFLESKEGKIKLSQKASIFFFCLILSTFFWFLSTLSKNYTADLSFPIKYVGYSDNFILVEEPAGNIKGQVFGSGYELLGEQFALNRKSIEVDLQSARPTKSNNTYFIETKRLREEVIEKLDRDIQLQFLKPDSIYFKTQARISKVVPVINRLELDFESGFQLRGDIRIEPSKVSISGPKSFIDTLQVLYTEEQEIGDIEDSLELNLKIVTPEEIKGVEMKSEQVRALIPVEKFTEKEVELDLKVITSSLETEIKTFPSKVVVKVLVPISLYENLDQSLIQAKVRYNSSKDRGANKLPVEIDGLPKYAKLIRIEPDRVEFILRK